MDLYNLICSQLSKAEEPMVAAKDKDGDAHFVFLESLKAKASRIRHSSGEFGVDNLLSFLWIRNFYCIFFLQSFCIL